tara:strand:+ start:1357 stop:2007 length:651 start_codon:yes stop_codon:yes gene_type:complete
MSKRVNIGCGTNPAEGWINMDNSLAIKLANSPFIYRLAKLLKLLNSSQIDNIEWNRNNSIQFADATKNLPFEENSIECIYTSHMLEHLSREGACIFLNEAYRSLKNGGVLRIAIPDINIHINEYISNKDADLFMEQILVEAPKVDTIKQKLQLFLTGYRHHQWMYDGNSLCKLLNSVGFKSVQVCTDGFTQISNPNGIDLYERPHDSVYVEGVKNN